MKKRVINLLAVLLMISMFPFAAFADEMPAFSVTSAEAKPGDEVEITVSCSDNPGITAWKLDINYDNNAMDLIDCNMECAFLKVMGSQTIDAMPYVISWSDDTKDVTTNGTMAVLKFKIKDTAGDGDYKISLKYDEDNVYDLSETNIAFETKDGTISVTAEKPKPPQTAVVTVDKDSYEVNENVKFSFSGELADKYVISIFDDNNSLVNSTEMTETSYTYAFDKAGKYSCTVTAYNDHGSLESSKIYFTVKKNESESTPTSKPESTPTPTSKPESTPTPTSKPESTPTPTSKPESTPTPIPTPTVSQSRGSSSTASKDITSKAVSSKNVSSKKTAVSKTPSVQSIAKADSDTDSAKEITSKESAFSSVISSESVSSFDTSHTSAGLTESSESEAHPPKKSKAPVIVIVLIVLAAVGGGVLFIVNKNKQSY